MKYSTHSDRTALRTQTHRPSHIHNHHSRRRNSLSAIINPVTLLLAAIAIIMTFSFGIRTVNASDKDDKTMYKYFTSITVQSDDTLWDIATRYSYNEKPKNYVSNIMSINNMTDETIYSGQDIVIYYYSDELKWCWDLSW